MNAQKATQFCFGCVFCFDFFFFFFGGGGRWVLKIKAPRPSSKPISVTIPHSPQLLTFLKPQPQMSHATTHPCAYFSPALSFPPS